MKSVWTVHAFDSFTAIVQTFRTDALTAGVMKPAVLRSAHRLAVLLTLTDGHAVIEVDHGTQGI